MNAAMARLIAALRPAAVADGGGASAVCAAVGALGVTKLEPADAPALRNACLVVAEATAGPDAPALVARLCRSGDLVLLLSDETAGTPFWAEQFARHEFFRDLDFRAEDRPGALLFRRASGQPAAIGTYERRIADLERRLEGYRLVAKEYVADLTAAHVEFEALRARLPSDFTLRLARVVRAVRTTIAPEGSRRDAAAMSALATLRTAARALGRRGPQQGP
jgi:hypothetical protein